VEEWSKDKVREEKKITEKNRERVAGSSGEERLEQASE